MYSLSHTRDQFLRVLLGLGLGISVPALSRPNEYQVNVREACRQAIAGGYLAAYDEREHVSTYLQALDEQIKALKDARKTALADYTKANDTLKVHGFDIDNASRKDETASVLANLDAQLKDYETMRRDSATQLTARRNEEARLRREVGSVFNFERVEDKADGGYPIHLAFKSPCPKYRALCPLPQEQANALANITVGGKTPEPCQRYASYSRIP